MDSDILNIEDIVMGRALPDPPQEVPPQRPAEPYTPITFKAPNPPSVQPYQHENLQCFQCFITFCNAKAKERHMKKSHREEYKQQLQQGNTLFTCYVCDRSFPSSEELTQHQPSHSKEDKPFKCAHCNESFRIFSELTTHRRHVCPEKQFSCKCCNETFRTAALLRTHRLAQHPRPDAEAGEQPPAADDPSKTHHCRKCGQGFETESELVEHQEKYTAGQQCNGNSVAVKKRGRPPKNEEKPGADKKVKLNKEEGETTEEAEKAAGVVAATLLEPDAAPSAAPVEVKAKVGGGKRGRPPKAATVPTATADESSPADDDETTTQDKKTKEPVLSARQHQCPECDVAFPGLLQLRAHKKEKHAPRKAHPCEECEESFARPEQLEAHRSRAHTAGRFACPTCGKSFGRERTMKTHEKSHLEEKSESQNMKR